MVGYNTLPCKASGNAWGSQARLPSLKRLMVKALGLFLGGHRALVMLVHGWWVIRVTMTSGSSTDGSSWLMVYPGFHGESTTMIVDHQLWVFEGGLFYASWGIAIIGIHQAYIHWFTFMSINVVTTELRPTSAIRVMAQQIQSNPREVSSPLSITGHQLSITEPRIIVTIWITKQL